jgi:hypothetical protein
MVLQRDVGQVETRFGLFGDSVNVDARKVIWIKQKLISIRLEIVLISAQEWCTFCTEYTIGMEIALGTPDGTPV